MATTIEELEVERIQNLYENKPDAIEPEEWERFSLYRHNERWVKRCVDSGRNYFLHWFRNGMTPVWVSIASMDAERVLSHFRKNHVIQADDRFGPWDCCLYLTRPDGINESQRLTAFKSRDDFVDPETGDVREDVLGRLMYQTDPVSDAEFNRMLED